MADDISRRTLLNLALIGAGASAAAVVSVPILAYLLSPLIHPAKSEWRDMGPVANFKIGDTVKADIQDPSPLPWAGETALTAVWVRRNGVESFTIFAVNCTHLGCPVNWLPDARIFLCPCHGGVYYANGDVAGGPPPRPLLPQPSQISKSPPQVKTPGVQAR